MRLFSVLTRNRAVVTRLHRRAIHSARPPAELQLAIDSVTSIPEVAQAAATSDAIEAHQLLSRTLDIVSRGDTAPSQQHAPSANSAVAHTLLAHHFRRTGDVEQERSHRLAALPSLADALPSVHIALALCCVRAPGGEGRLAAAAAATEARHAAVAERDRLTASLLSAVVADPPSRRILLSGLAAADQGGAEPDVGGIASYVLSKDTLHAHAGNGDKDKELASALDAAAALVERWSGRTFELVEALLLQAGLTRAVRGKDGLTAADEVVARALKEVERIGGGRADKAEPLLLLARHAVARGDPVMAEGLFRAFEEAMDGLWQKKAFTVAAADVYARGMDAYSQFLSDLSTNGVPRTTEATEKAGRARNVREMFPQVLDSAERSVVDLWIIEWLSPYFDLKLPV